VFLIDAEHDGFLVTVAALFEERRDLLRREEGTVVKHQRAVEVRGVVDAVLDLVTFAVQLALFGPVAFHVPVDMNLDDLVGRQKAVADPLLQRIGEHRLAEIFRVGDVFRLLRRGGQADLRRAGKMVEDFTPGGVLGGAAAMAFVDDNQVEEVLRELLEQLLALFRPGDRLVEAEIDLEGGVDAPFPVERQRKVDRGAVLPFDGLGIGRKLRHRRAKGAEVVHHRLVDQHIAVGEEQDALVAFRIPTLRFPQPPDDLEGGVGLARTGRHDQQNPVLAFGDGLNRRVDGIHLIVARLLSASVVVVILKNDLLGFAVEPFPGAKARP